MEHLTDYPRDCEYSRHCETDPQSPDYCPVRRRNMEELIKMKSLKIKKKECSECNGSGSVPIPEEPSEYLPCEACYPPERSDDE